jgi:ABC-type taurine transport system ATPase subunit
MLTKLSIRNFKRFDDVEIDLGSPVVFIGPNNSGKTTALQAMALWSLGLKRWQEKHGSGKAPSKRPGVAINRKDFVAAPIPSANLLWRDLHVRDLRRDNGKLSTDNVRIDIEVAGVSSSRAWTCGLEFDYANDESLYCRPLSKASEGIATRAPVPPEAHEVRVAFLPPLSGLADREFAKQAGEVSFLIGQGRTAEVLRNLCLQVSVSEEKGDRWDELTKTIQDLFGIRLLAPVFIPERGEITMSYQDQSGIPLDLSCSGRGVQQTLLLLAYLAVNPQSVLLLDEPDAHLEILRQRQIYRVLSETAMRQRSQIIAASHSEVVLNEAADRDVVVAFVGKPHRMDDRGAQVLKALKEIGFEQYYQAEQRGWVLYLEGSTDLAILQAFARALNHPVGGDLDRPFVHYVENQPRRAREHFFGLREAKPDLVGFLLCDRLDRPLQPTDALGERAWTRREIENYLCQPATLFAFAESLARQEIGPLFEEPELVKYREAMSESIRELVPPLALQDLNDPWWRDTKVTDNYLDRLFERFFTRLGLPNLMRKTNYHRLAEFVPTDLIDPEVQELLDAIRRQAERARPADSA